MTTLMTLDGDFLSTVTGGQRTDPTPTPAPTPQPPSQCTALCYQSNNSGNTTITGNNNNNFSGNEAKLGLDVPGAPK